MILVVHGFESHSEALAFEWAWQNPLKSKNARDAVNALEGRGTTAAAGARGRVRVLFAMLNAPRWLGMPLTVTALSSTHANLIAASLPAGEAEKGLPRGMRLETARVEALVVGRVPAALEGQQELERDPESSSDGEEEGEEEEEESSRRCCSCCSLPIKPGTDFIPCASSPSAPSSSAPSSPSLCRARSHPECLADSFLAQDSSGGGVVPTKGRCPLCEREDSWLACLERVEEMRPLSISSSPARRGSKTAAAAAAAAAEATPEKKQSPPQRRRRRARVTPKATPEELAAFATAARENAPPAAAAPGAAAAFAARIYPSKRPPLPETNGEPILIGSSSSDEGGGEEEERAARAPAAASSLPLSPLASRLAALSPPSSSLRGGARPGEWPQSGQQLLRQQPQRAARARALRFSSSSAAASAPTHAPARLPLPILPPSSRAVASALLASSIAAAASRGRLSGARAARALRGLMLF